MRSTVRWESVIIAVFGTVGGIGLGSFLGWGLVRALEAQEGFGTFALPVVPLAVVLGLAAAAGVARRRRGPPAGPPRPTSSPPSPPTSENDTRR